MDNIEDYARKLNGFEKIQNNVLITSYLRLDIYILDLTDKRLPNIKVKNSSYSCMLIMR